MRRTIGLRRTELSSNLIAQSSKRVHTTVPYSVSSSCCCCVQLYLGENVSSLDQPRLCQHVSVVHVVILTAVSPLGSFGKRILSNGYRALDVRLQRESRGSKSRHGRMTIPPDIRTVGIRPPSPLSGLHQECMCPRGRMPRMSSVLWQKNSTKSNSCRNYMVSRRDVSRAGARGE